jgi:uncharacterized ferritin-like protein (DUF455 family)
MSAFRTLPTLTAGAAAILATADPWAKAAESRRLAASWRDGAVEIGDAPAPARPARPSRPLLRPPKEMPKRRAFGSPAGRIALLHALAHIELNAIDLAWDIVARFCREGLPRAFFDDWVEVAAEEALHFELLARRLTDFGARYGDLPAHVAAGVRWFDELCRARGLVPDETFRDRVRRYFRGALKPPFNHEARAAAGFPAHYYEPLLGSLPRGAVPPPHG